MTTPDVPPIQQVVFYCHVCSEWVCCPYEDQGEVTFEQQKHITLEEATALTLGGAARRGTRPCDRCWRERKQMDDWRRSK